ncbi:MAG: glycosyltransferase family 39 protein [Vulcanimicrobiota bacterium]
MDLGLLSLLIIASGLLFYRIEDPDSYIFDETYYVQAARVIDGQPVQPEGLPSDWFSRCDPNREHPPLAKVIMAAGIHYIQAPGISWRFPSIILGLVSLVCVYSIVGRLGNRTMARWAVAILMTENLFFIHSRIATLDIYVATFDLLALAFYVRNRPEFAGISLALATVCKLNGLFLAGVPILYEMFCWAVSRKSDKPEKFRFKPLIAFFAFYLPFMLLSLGALDNQWTEFRNPFAHLKHIVTYGKNLAREAGVEPQGIESTPLQWWLNEKNIDYFTMSLTKGANSATPIRFRGILSPYLLMATPFAALYCLQRCRKGDRLACLGLIVIVCNYLPFLLTWLKYRRICYIYYMLPIVPALTIITVCLLSECPRWARWVFLAAHVYSLALYFPFHGGAA